MNLKITVSWILYIYLFKANPIFNQVELSSFFADNMVLQQNDFVPIWRTDMSNTDIQIVTNWSIDTFTRTDTKESWENITENITVSYGFGNCFKETLFNLVRLPVSSFRTDTW
ncbi:hypothetical protein AAY42_16645 [Flagellimonas eckloniae]|uniref:Uncharacterized protein n=2 Tax=Flagellimonas eckloniae TaxID=346185 RepID=A0A0Q0X158_9FLAO|nr:hypothetical protein AAY42_16645 [Allomuricauda eckloniae]